MDYVAEPMWFIVPLTSLSTLLALLAYLSFRIYCIITTQTYESSQLILAWIIIVIETAQNVPTVLLYFSRAFVSSRPHRPQLHTDGDNVPTVDVLITACNEDPDMVINVVRAACESDYPKDKLRIILTDDGQDQRLAQMMSQIKTKYSWAFYTSREKPDVPDYKAGNLNHGFHWMESHGKSPSELVAGLDADMIIRPKWLRVMVPYLLADERLGMIVTPQSFYNLPLCDDMRQDLDYFFAVTEYINEGLGASHCTGTGYLVRRKALDDVQGFPSFSLSEDTACSSLLLGKGWKVVHIDERLQCGEMPVTLIGHIKQRTRWTMGNVQTALKLNFRLFGRSVSACTARQRLAGGVFCLSPTVNATLGFLGYIGPPLALLSGYPMVIYDNIRQLTWLIRLVSIWIIIDCLHRGSLALYVGYRDAMRWDQAEAWLIPYYFYSFIRMFMLPKGLGGQQLGFRSSGSFSSTIKERKPHASCLYHRFRSIFIHQMVWFHVLFLVTCFTGIVLNFVRCFNNPTRLLSAYDTSYKEHNHKRWVFLLTHVGWPPVFWLLQSMSCWIPIGYLISPPVEVTAEEALQFDEKTGVRYPKDDFWGPRRRLLGRWSDHLTLAVLFYTLFCLVGSRYL